MSVTDNYYTAKLLEDEAELHFSCGGLWDVAKMQEFYDHLGEKLAPIFKARRPYSCLGDFTDALPQDSATADLMMTNLQASKKYGLKRVAILNASPIMKLQYKRVSAGLDVAFFESKAEALAWLRH